MFSNWFGFRIERTKLSVFRVSVYLRQVKDSLKKSIQAYIEVCYFPHACLRLALSGKTVLRITQLFSNPLSTKLLLKSGTV